MRLAIYQMADYGEPRENLDRAREAIGGCDADFFILPEFFVIPGGDYKKDYTPEQVYRETGKPGFEMLREASSGFPGYLVGGTVIEKAPEGCYNTCYVFRRGDVVAKYRKINLADEEIAMQLLPGSELVTFDTEWGKAGLLVCFDVCKDTRDQVSAACDIVLLPVGMSVPDHPRTEGHPLCEEMALRHSVTVAKVCRVGFYDGEPLVSASAVVTPRGVEWEGSEEGEEFSVVTVALDPVA